MPAPGEPGSETWSGDAWKTGGGSIWVTGSYDPALNLTYWGTGNPGPDFNPAQRPGDNLYTNSVVALDADTGKLKWHFQFTPADRYDWDATQVPVLVDATWQRRDRAKLLMLANRNGFFYVLDRVTGKFLLGKPFVKQNWASGLDENGRPIQTPQPPGATTWPGTAGRHELVFPLVQSAHGSVLRLRVGEHGRRLQEPGIRLQARRQFHGRRLQDDAGGARRAGAAEHPACDRSTTGRTPPATAP